MRPLSFLARDVSGTNALLGTALRVVSKRAIFVSGYNALAEIEPPVLKVALMIEREYRGL